MSGDTAYEFGVIAIELRYVRKHLSTIGDTSKAFAEVMERIKTRGVSQEVRLLFGEMLWFVLHEKNVTDDLGAALDEIWLYRDRDMKTCRDSNHPRSMKP